MAGYGVKDANRALRERKDTKPKVNVCGACGEDCNDLLCEECKADIATAGYQKHTSGNWRQG